MEFSFVANAQNINSDGDYLQKPRTKEASLRQDFIDKQRAYFAEIDAFELPVEVASESELE